jgi:hypothetical protein
MWRDAVSQGLKYLPTTFHHHGCINNGITVGSLVPLVKGSLCIIKRMFNLKIPVGLCCYINCLWSGRYSDYMRSPGYVIIMFLKVLHYLNFAQVKIVTVIYVRTYVCMHVCACFHFVEKDEIMKRWKHEGKSHCKHRKLILTTTKFHLHLENVIMCLMEKSA